MPEAARLDAFVADTYWPALHAVAAGTPIARPDVVVRPRTEDEVADVVRIADEHGVPVVPWGGGSGTQGICYNEDGLPERYRGGLFFCDWGTQSVTHYGVAKEGGTFRVVAKEKIAEKGDLGDFRPFSLATAPDGASLYLVDWAYNGWLARGPVTGRLFRLAYDGPDAANPSPRPTGTDLAARIAALDHPALSVRLDAQRRAAKVGKEAIAPLAARLKATGPTPGRLHALWALDAIEREWIPADRRANLRDTALARLREQPGHWQRYYHSSGDALAIDLQYSLSDRIRYYWPDTAIDAACQHLFANLRQTPPPMPLIGQYLPQALRTLRADHAPLDPEALVMAHIATSLDDYHHASRSHDQH